MVSLSQNGLVRGARHPCVSQQFRGLIFLARPMKDLLQKTSGESLAESFCFRENKLQLWQRFSVGLLGTERQLLQINTFEERSFLFHYIGGQRGSKPACIFHGPFQ